LDEEYKRVIEKQADEEHNNWSNNYDLTINDVKNLINIESRKLYQNGKNYPF
jgi:hypothetical protein